MTSPLAGYVGRMEIANKNFNSSYDQEIDTPYERGIKDCCGQHRFTCLPANLMKLRAKVCSSIWLLVAKNI